MFHVNVVQSGSGALKKYHDKSTCDTNEHCFVHHNSLF